MNVPPVALEATASPAYKPAAALVLAAEVYVMVTLPTDSPFTRPLLVNAVEPVEGLVNVSPSSLEILFAVIVNGSASIVNAPAVYVML